MRAIADHVMTDEEFAVGLEAAILQEYPERDADTVRAVVAEYLASPISGSLSIAAKAKFIRERLLAS